MDKDKLRQAAKKIRAFASQRRELKAYLGMAPVKTEIVRAEMAIAELDADDSLLDRRLDELDAAKALLHLARSAATRAAGSKDKALWETAYGYFRRARDFSRELRIALEENSRAALELPSFRPGETGDGIQTADGIPLVPPIMPVVFLQGGDRDMGRQYALQIAGLFGEELLSRKAGRAFSTAELEELRRWEAQLADCAPEFLAFAEGMAEGARSIGLAMSYDDALALWTGVLPPETDYMGAGGARMNTVPPLACSGVAAWGAATADGRLVTGSAGDFDPTFTATIAAWPSSGNAFVFTPFGATGDVPALGSINFFGHPGMNSKGLAYVHHGGTPRMLEPKQSWGYGLRRAPGVMHVLRFASSVREARDMELAFPIGDVGLDSGTVGGFWADDREGCVLECRKDPILVREAGLLGERDFLYSANSALHPEAGACGWLAKEAERWEWSAPGGWRPRRFSFFHRLGLVYHGSSLRCGAFFKLLDREHGRIDFETMTDCYREGGTVPPGEWKAMSRQYRKTGRWGELSPGNASNGILAFMKPSEGRYSVCVGGLAPGLAPTSPLFASANPVHGATHEYWDLRLAGRPDDTAREASDEASRAIRAAEAAIASAAPRVGSSSLGRAARRLEEARAEAEIGFRRIREALETEGDERLGLVARAACRFLKAQVRARQASRAVASPAEAD
jgi:hypothetical protein